MANVKITDMPQATTIGGDDIIPIVQGGINKQIKASNYATNFYSTTERVVGAWIDGKPLYERVASVTMTHTGNTGGYNLGELVSNNIDYATIVSIFVTNGGATVGLYNGYSANAYNEIYIEATKTNANYGYLYGFTDKTYFLNTPIYAVCRYTKTTDSVS